MPAISYAFLGIKFNPTKLKQDLSKMLDEQFWVEHVNSNAHKGGWQVRPLRCKSQLINTSPILQAFSIEGTEAYQNLPALDSAVEFKSALSQLKCKIKSVRLMRLDPGCHITPHRDKGLSLEQGEARIHIPIQTSENLKFFVDGQIVPMSAGEYWYINADQVHEVQNLGSESRINLVIDCEVSDWLRDKVYKHSFENINEKLDFKTQTEQLIQKVLKVERNGLYQYASEIQSWVKQISNLTGLGEPVESGCERGTLTKYGKACSTITAMRCAQEFMRTMQFWRGTYEAISYQLQNHKTINILYAGTGPFGTILLPILHLFPDSRVRVHLLDIHQESISYLKKVIEYLNLGKFIGTIECVDATKWSSTLKFDVLISETMKAMLEQEPQVEIFTHLEPLLNHEGSLIPQEIVLSASLTQSKNFSENYYLGEIATLNRESVKRIQSEGIDALSRRIRMPETSERFKALELNTVVKIFGKHSLDKNECSLNLPKLHYLKARANSFMTFKYHKIAYPKFDFEYVAVQCDSELPLISREDSRVINKPGLARYWHKQFKACSGKVVKELETEFDADRQLFEKLSINIFSALAFIQGNKASLEEFENWLDEQLAVNN